MEEFSHPFLATQIANVILVDLQGTAYLIVAPPASCSRRLYSSHCSPSTDALHQSGTPLQDQCKLTHIVSDTKYNDNKKRAAVNSPEIPKRQKISPLQSNNQAYIETAILERKTLLEKGAEQRAELIFKQWNKEKKTLEQAIDESFR